MKTKVGILAVVCLALFAAGCGSSPQNLIIGKWETSETPVKMTAEFAKDGKAKLTIFGKPVQGTYKLNGDELEWSLNGKSTKCKAKLSATEMELTSDGKTIKYKKV